MKIFSLLAVILSLLLWCPSGAFATDSGVGESLFRASCQSCHGADAQGGHSGDYPRLAGLPQEYLEVQLRAFLDQTRQNKPMIPVFKTGGIAEGEIAEVASFLSGLPVPEITPDPHQEQALLADLAAEEEEPGMEPDLEWGEEIYEADCALCHGKAGEGKADTPNPPLVDQYPRYLAKQVGDFVTGLRWHEFAKALFKDRDSDELQSMIAYLFEIARGIPAEG